MTKQEKIQQAYGEEAWSIIGKYVDKDGWLHTDHLHDPVSINKPIYQDFGTPPGYSCITWVRPKSLQGIETNNGWIKIESVEDLPDLLKDNDTAYWVIYKNGDTKTIYSLPFSPFRKDEWIKNVGYYQPIIKPQPPIY